MSSDLKYVFHVFIEKVSNIFMNANSPHLFVNKQMFSNTQILTYGMWNSQNEKAIHYLFLILFFSNEMMVYLESLVYNETKIML